MFSLRSVSPAAAAACAVLVASSTAHAAATQTVKLRFKAVAGDTPISCDAPISGLGTTNQTANLKDLRFFVSEVKLLRRKGSSATLKIAPNKDFRVASKAGSVSLIDLEDGRGACAEEGTAATNAVVIGTVPKGIYTGARFTLGVPFALNHTNSAGAPGPLALTAMAWSWQYGRKFMKVEVADPNAAASSGGMKMGMDMPMSTTPATSGAWASPTYYVHVGSTGCTGNPATGAAVSCDAPNRANVRLTKFDPAKQQIAVDLRALLSGDDLAKSPDMMPGCMSGPDDPECGSVFKALGINWAAIGKGTGLPTNSQTVFRAIDR